ncbi:glutamate synthase subunit beta [candidate division KSB1 bacterium]|nr:glutamate synthase subunit beta [candidate division KSB1 bacterium]RQW10503.1 MAG: glutamate synthase subunit beta [candidate division KSB1 bacterium]
MARATGFMEYAREEAPKRLVHQRVRDYGEFEQLLPETRLIEQAARCMDCGVPSCHMYGCPLENRIPDFNDLVYKNHWRRALEVLHSTNNFPEVTGRICPAPCETACTLGISQLPVNIKHIELQIVERGFREGWINPNVPIKKTNKRIAVIGSGPAGLAAAQQLARAGHDVVLMERADRIGGLLRYGIPDFKLEKWILDRRMEQMAKEGVTFETGVDVGVDLSVHYLQRSFHAVIIAAGATVPRDLPVPGRELDGVHFAMEFLQQQNKVNAGDVSSAKQITARDKHVIVIGGGDTGSDCVGTSIRQGARSVTQLELLPKPPQSRASRNPWPEWPTIYRTSSSHQEGCDRHWSVQTTALEGVDGAVKKLKALRLDWQQAAAEKWTRREIAGSEFELDADLVLLAMGFLHVAPGPLVQDFGLRTDQRGNIVVDANMMTTEKGVFAAGDAVLGASLVVRAIYQGRRAAAGANIFLKQS